jgi:hypothetical protein
MEGLEIFLIEQLPLTGELYRSSARASKKFYSKFSLKIRYRLTDCRLRDMDSARRFSQALPFDGRDEVPEMSELHG